MQVGDVQKVVVDLIPTYQALFDRLDAAEKALDEARQQRQGPIFEKAEKALLAAREATKHNFANWTQTHIEIAGRFDAWSLLDSLGFSAFEAPIKDLRKHPTE